MGFRNGLFVFIMFAFACLLNPIGFFIVPAEWYSDNMGNVEFEFSAIASRKTVGDIKYFEITDDSYLHLRSISIREVIHGVEEPLE